jgi:hypothetical protein
MHWHNFQVNVLVLISYQPNFVPHDRTNLDSGLIKEVHYFVSDDTSHDTFFVHHASLEPSTKSKVHSKQSHCLE